MLLNMLFLLLSVEALRLPQQMEAEDALGNTPRPRVVEVVRNNKSSSSLSPSRRSMMEFVMRKGSRTLMAAEMSIMENTMNQNLFEWADSYMSKIDTNNWPALASGSFDMGLHRPIVYVISLKERNKMRRSFAKRYNKLGLQAEAKFFPGIWGEDVPAHLINPSGENATGAEWAWNEAKGVFGCYLAHMLVYRDALKKCPLCDVVVLEDDTAFHPRFRELWTEFIQNAPRGNIIAGGISKLVGHYHIGGDMFWEPVTETRETYYVGGWLSRTWGYVMLGEELQEAFHYLQDVDHSVNMGIDQVLSGSSVPYHVVTPKSVLVVALPSGKSMTAYRPGTTTNVPDDDVDEIPLPETHPGWIWHS